MKIDKVDKSIPIVLEYLLKQDKILIGDLIINSVPADIIDNVIVKLESQKLINVYTDGIEINDNGKDFLSRYNAGFTYLNQINRQINNYGNYVDGDVNNSTLSVNNSINQYINRKQNENAISKLLKLIWAFIEKHLLKIITALIIAFLVWHFGFNKPK
jgi:ABC-type antimicrobial peptide transport system permease subunit